MLEIIRRLNAELNTGAAARRVAHWLTLPYEMRQKSRFKAKLEDGEDVAVLLGRGTSLRHGDILEASDGTLVGIRASSEQLSIARAPDRLSLLRAAYHLGNRHVALQIQDGQLLYQHDHVLDAMLVRLGLSVASLLGPFEPEPGAYHGHAHDRQDHTHGDPAHGDATHSDHTHASPSSEQRLRSEQAYVPREDQGDIPTQVELVRPRRK